MSVAEPTVTLTCCRCRRAIAPGEVARQFRIDRSDMVAAGATDTELESHRRDRWGLFCPRCVTDAPENPKERVAWSLAIGKLLRDGKCGVCGGNLPRVGGCKLCEMFATGRAPRGVTDDTRFAGFSKVGGAQFGSDEIREAYMQPAREAGVDVTGKQYFSELAAYPGDPEAWVDSQGDMRRLLEKRGWGCDGDLKVKAKNGDGPPKGVGLADDIVDDLVEQRLEERHGPLDGVRIKTKEYHDTRAEVVATHSPPAHLAD